MSTPEDIKKIVHEELAKCEEKVESWVRKEIAGLNIKANDAIIDRNSVHQMLEQINKNLDRILEQTTKTNGRVGSLEKWKDVHAVETAHLEKAVDVFQTYLSRLNWIVIVAVAGAVLSLIFV
jgi:chromosome segregation ATPase